MSTDAAFSLRPAQYDDYNFLWNLHRSALREAIEATWGWEEAFQAAWFRDHFSVANRQIILVEGRPVGALEVQDQGATVFLAYIALASDQQRRGLGTRIIREIVADAGHRSVTLKVLKSNPARRLYERLGFVITEVGEHHVWMTHVAPRQNVEA